MVINLRWCFISLFYFSVLATSSAFPLADRSQIAIRQELTPIEQVKQLSDSAYSMEKEKPYKAINFYETAISISRTNGLLIEEGKNTRYIGLVYKERAILDSALVFLLKADSVLYRSTDTSEIAKARFSVATVYQLKGDFEKATFYYTEALNNFEKTRNQIAVSKCSANLGALYYDLGQYTKAIYYDSIAVELSKSNNDKNSLTAALINLGNARMTGGFEHLGLDNFFEALELAVATNDDYNLIYINGNIADYYAKHKDYSSALSYSKKAKEIAIKQGLSSEISFYSHQHGYFKVKMGDFSGMQEMLYSLQLNKELGLNNDRILLLRNIAEGYALQGSYKKALEYTRKSYALKDSLFTETTLKNINDLRLKYETEKKEKQIAALEFAGKLEKANFNQKRLRLIYFIIFLSLFLFLSIIIIVFYRQKLKTNSLIAQQQDEINQRKINELEQQQMIQSMESVLKGQEEERKRIASDLHDGLGGLLSTIQIHFTRIQDELQALQKLKTHVKAFELLDDACVEVRKIAHDMMPGSLEKLGLVPAINDIAESIGQSDSLNVIVQEFGESTKMESTRTSMVYRIVQELMNNTIKHASANELIVQFNWHEQMLNVLVEDNGKGFNYNEKVLGLGLKSIQSRINYLKASIEIETGEGQGTSISLSIPL